MRRHSVVLALASTTLVLAISQGEAADGATAGSECAAPCTVDVRLVGTGSGFVSGTIPAPDGCVECWPPIACPTRCLVGAEFGVDVTLVAAPAPGSVFTGWGGACDWAVGPECHVWMNTNPKVFYAYFDREGDPPTPIEDPPPSVPPPPPPPPAPAPPAPPPPPQGPPGLGCTIVGTSGDDELVGTPGDDVICGLGGDDHIHAGGGKDVVHGGPGADEIELGAGGHTAYGGRGADLIIGGSGPDLLDGGAGSDIVRGGAGDDRVAGGSGRDVLAGGPGRDLVTARDGAQDGVRGGPGRDTAWLDRLDRVRSVETLTRRRYP